MNNKEYFHVIGYSGFPQQLCSPLIAPLTKKYCHINVILPETQYISHNISESNIFTDSFPS